MLTAYRFASFLVFLLAWMQPAVAGDPDRSKGDRAEQTDSIFSALRSNNAPGAAVLVLKDGSISFQRGYGVADLRTRHQINAQTNFRLASVTKQFTAMAVMLLVHDGKQHYDDRLTDIFPDFPEYGKGISIRNLLNHTSGLQDYEDLIAQPDPTTAQRDDAQSQIPQIQDAEVLELLKRQNTTKFTPGTKWAYSNSGYVALGLIVARVSGKPFGQFLHERIFAPLKMNHTLAYRRGQNQVAHRAYGHTKVGKQWVETDQSATSATLGDGGIYSSLEDLAKWDAALSRHTLLSAAEMRPALTPVEIPGGSPEEPDGKPAKYGFGWFLNPHQGHARMWHYGETIGFRTSIQRFVDDQLTVIVLSNRSDVDARDLSLKVASWYLK
ncbi:MAG TPA: serine hydrolase domain-containing protein [Candidatus Sulfotelmatobacter sp.]|nr:serine hydrolase domain-containing protein [Candidatus Sulfotelmatobacter sp.]